MKTLQVDVRIISATNRDLQKDVAEKRFREDLFYRLNVFPLQLPPLRDRRSDIPVLVHHFVRKHAARMGRQIELIPNETMRVLQHWNWPGNIRELENMIERMVILSKGQTLAPPPAELHEPQGLGEDTLTEMEREHIIRVLRKRVACCRGRKGRPTASGSSAPHCSRCSSGSILKSRTSGEGPGRLDQTNIYRIFYFTRRLYFFSTSRRRS